MTTTTRMRSVKLMRIGMIALQGMMIPAPPQPHSLLSPWLLPLPRRGVNSEMKSDSEAAVARESSYPGRTRLLAIMRIQICDHNLRMRIPMAIIIRTEMGIWRQITD